MVVRVAGVVDEVVETLVNQCVGRSVKILKV